MDEGKNFGYVIVSLKKRDGGHTTDYATKIHPVQEPTVDGAVAAVESAAAALVESLRTEWRGPDVLEWFLGHGFDETAPQFEYLKPPT